MSENSKLPKLLTNTGFHALHARHGFTQSEKGTADILNAALVEMATGLTRSALLQAEHDGHAGLNGSHAKKAISMNSEIPKGFY
jgi:hypothetical protein